MSKELAKEWLAKMEYHCGDVLAVDPHNELEKKDQKELQQALEWVEKQNDWVSVEDRLPEVGSKCIVDLGYDVRQCVFRERGFDIMDRCDVINWMYFPKSKNT